MTIGLRSDMWRYLEDYRGLIERRANTLSMFLKKSLLSLCLNHCILKTEIIMLNLKILAKDFTDDIYRSTLPEIRNTFPVGAG